MFTQFCLDTEANLWGLFTTDPEIIPSLLWYAYIPVLVLALMLGVLVYMHRTSFKSPNKAFFGLTLVFALYLLNEILMWTAVPAGVSMFGWQSFLLYRVLLALLLVIFVYTFALQQPVTKRFLVTALALALPIVVLIPTSYNMLEFDVAWCEAHSGVLVWYLYFLELLAALTIAWISFVAFRKATTGSRRALVLLLFIGSELFISFQSFAEVYGELTREFEINLVGPVGVLLFLAIIAYMIVRYQTFNIKVFGAQALVITLWILIGSLLLVVKSDTSRIIAVFTFLLTVLIGINLIRSVRKEVEARELLAEANRGQERFIHFLSHEIKGFLTVGRNGYAAIAEGDYGPTPEPLTKMAKVALERLNTGVTVVEGILKSANLKSGKVQFKFAPFDICAAIRKRIDVAQPLLQERKLTLNAVLPDGDYIIVGDAEHLTDHVIKNLIENAIFYTPAGSITVALARKANSVVFSVKDTGVGITAEDKKRLFTEGGQGVNAMKVNAHSTGHGLFIAKTIVEAHGGRIWADSEGEGKGTTFYVELPVNPAPQKK